MGRLRNSTWQGTHNVPCHGTRTVLVDFPPSSRAARRASRGKRRFNLLPQLSMQYTKPVPHGTTWKLNPPSVTQPPQPPLTGKQVMPELKVLKRRPPRPV